MDDAQVNEIADRLFAAFMAHDHDTVRELLAPDARCWSNATGQEQDPEALIGFMPLMRSAIGDHVYGDVRRMVTPDGFVEQHSVRSTKPDGTVLELGDVAVVVRLDADGRVTRMDEYLDTALVQRTLAG